MPSKQQEIEFCNLLSRNHRTINSICLRFCGDNAFYFDELRQECAMAIWAEFSRHGLNRFRGYSSESTWIYQISYHAIINYLRNPSHQEFLSISHLYGPETLSLRQSLSATQGNLPLDDWNLLDHLTSQLNPNERNLLHHYLNNDPYSTIAHSEGITESNARKRMSRLLLKLKKLIHK